MDPTRLAASVAMARSIGLVSSQLREATALLDKVRAVQALAEQASAVVRAHLWDTLPPPLAPPPHSPLTSQQREHYI